MGLGYWFLDRLLLFCKLSQNLVFNTNAPCVFNLWYFIFHIPYTLCEIISIIGCQKVIRWILFDFHQILFHIFCEFWSDVLELFIKCIILRIKVHLLWLFLVIIHLFLKSFYCFLFKHFLINLIKINFIHHELLIKISFIL